MVTYARRFEQPLSIETAIAKTRFWSTASNVKMVFPDYYANSVFLEWLEVHRLGRKRLLDTMLLATYYSNNVSSIITSNKNDFQNFTMFTVLSL